MITQYVDVGESQDTVREISAILSRPTIYDTPPVLSLTNGFLSDRLEYSTLNEEYVVEKIIRDYQQRKQSEANLWRVGASVAATLLGLGDGFQFTDFIGGVVAGGVASNIIKGIQDLDGNQLKELGLEWVHSPVSYLYHQKRHRGHAVRRLIVITPHSISGVPCAAFAIQFPDGYVGYLGMPPSSMGFAGQFCMDGAGFNTDWVKHQDCLAELPRDNGRSLPVELWRNDQDDALFVVPYKAPHHSFY